MMIDRPVADRGHERVDRRGVAHVDGVHERRDRLQLGRRTGVPAAADHRVTAAGQRQADLTPQALGAAGYQADAAHGKSPVAFGFVCI